MPLPRASWQSLKSLEHQVVTFVVTSRRCRKEAGFAAIDPQDFASFPCRKKSGIPWWRLAVVTVVAWPAMSRTLVSSSFTTTLSDRD
jgi:hypothetical protein